MEQCVCTRILTVYNNTYLCAVCGWSKPIPSGTLILSSTHNRQTSSEKFINEKKVIVENNTNPNTFHKCEKCNKVTKHRMIIEDNNFVSMICFECA